jgi:hypothetical protein
MSKPAHKEVFIVSSTFLTALLSEGPAADRAAQMALYGRFVGSWEMDGVIYRPDGSRDEGRGEIHFAWALEGRAIQDVWILPGAFYGTTLRVYDPGLDAWHILWSDPLKQYFTRQLGRERDGEIVQEGAGPEGVPIRWRFTSVTRTSFHWLGEISSGEWALQAEFHARRVSG